MVGCILLAALLMDAATRAHWIGSPAYPHQALMWRETWAANYFRPLTQLSQSIGDFQPGWGLWLGGVAACRRGAIAVQAVFGAIVMMLPLVLPWSRLRTMPILAALLALGALLALREEQQATVSQRRRWLVGSVAVLAVLWGAWQARLMPQRGYRATAPRAVAERDWRTENAPLDRYAYDLLPIPRYFSHGKSNPRLEIRLLDECGDLAYGPGDGGCRGADRALDGEEHLAAWKMVTDRAGFRGGTGRAPPAPVRFRSHSRL
jgi:hypothetical protein